MTENFTGDMEGILGVMVPIVAIVGGLSLAFGLRYLRNREIMEMISRGMDVSALNLPRRRRNPLALGLAAIGAGIGLLLGFMVCQSFSISRDDHAIIYFGSIALFVGIGVVLSHVIERKNSTPADNG